MAEEQNRLTAYHIYNEKKKLVNNQSKNME